MPIASAGRDFPFITRGNANQVVGAFEVQLDKDLGGTEALEGLRDEWKWTNRTGAPEGDSERRIKTFFRFPSMYSRNSKFFL